MDRVRRAVEWVRALFARHLVIGDGIVALLCLLPVFASISTVTARGWWVTPAIVLMLACCWVPLFWRRRRPELATAVVMAGHVLQLIVMDTPTGMNVVVPVMTYALARYAVDRRIAHVLMAIGLLGAVVGALDWSFSGRYSAPDPMVYVVANAFFNALVLTSGWGFGLLARQRAQSMTQLRERAEALERERDQRAKLAAEEERTRIAREMHDVVAHSLSVIVVQADGAQYAVEHGDPARSGQLAAQALGTISATAREALADTRRLVAVLRGGEGEAAYTPQAGVGDLDDLVEPLRQAGRPIDLVVTGTPVPLPRDADLAVYRVVQEALTNVIKHAGDWASVRIDLRYSGDAVQVSVADDGRGASAADDGSGHGVIGMRERVAAYGGTLRAGPRPGGGFVVEASIPLGRDDAAVRAERPSTSRQTRSDIPDESETR